MGGIVTTTGEPMIGLMRLAWWRDALERLDRERPPAEPLLAALAGRLLPLGPTGASLAAIEHGWAALLDGAADEEAIARHGRERGGQLFACAAELLAAGAAGLPIDEREGVAAAGAGWALADLAHRHSDASVRAEARRQARAALDRGPRRWPAPLRPLGALAALAARDAAADAPRRQGSPGRLLRMLAMRLAGR